MGDTRSKLKSYFQTGSAPTQGEFANLIDGMLNSADDHLTILPSGNDRHLGIGINNPDSPLTIKENEETRALVSFQLSEQKKTWSVKHISGSSEVPGLNIGEYSGGDGQLFLQPGGHIGMGTITPVANLEIKDDQGPWIRLGSSNAVSAIEQSENDLIISNASPEGCIFWGIGHPNNERPSQSNHTLVALDADGNLGIGNIAPHEKLQVEGNILVGSNETAEQNVIISPQGIQARISDEPDDLLINNLGGNVGIGTEEPQAKLHIHDDQDKTMLLSGKVKPSLMFKAPEKTPAEIVLKDNKTLSFLNTLVHIESPDEEGLTIISEAAATLTLIKPNPDTGSDNIGMIRVTSNGLTVQSGPETDPGVISLNGLVAFGTENPLAALHIASQSDDLLMLEGQSVPSMKFKDSGGKLAKVAFSEGNTLTVDNGENGPLEKINLIANVNVQSFKENASFSLISQEEIPLPDTTTDGQDGEEGDENTEEGQELTTYEISMEAKSNPVFKMRGFENREAAIEFNAGNTLKFHNGADQDLSKFLFNGNMEVRSIESTASLKVVSSSNNVVLNTSSKPGLRFQNSEVIADIELAEDTLEIVGITSLDVDASINISRSAQISENVKVEGDLEVAGTTKISDVQISGKILSQISAEEGLELKGDLLAKGNVQFKKELEVTKAAVLKDTLTVTKEAEFKSNCVIEGSATINGPVAIAQDLTVTGPTQLNGSTTISGSFTTEALTATESGINVKGRTEITGDLAQKGNFDLDGNFAVEGNISVNGEIAGFDGLKSGKGISAHDGKVQRDFYTQHINTTTALKLTTNLKKGSDTQYRILVEGYNATSGSSINSEIVGKAGSEIEGASSIDHTEGITLSQAYEGNNLVLTITPKDGSGEIGFSVSAWIPNNEDAFNIIIQ